MGTAPPLRQARPNTSWRFEVTELAHRNADGVEVSLHWDRAAEDLVVLVEDSRTGDRFSLAAARERALDVFYHPYAYAARATR
jgi:hypothetical protein